LNRNTVYLHLKECEFRYNHRNEELYEVLLNLLKTHTLLSRLGVKVPLTFIVIIICRHRSYGVLCQ